MQLKISKQQARKFLLKKQLLTQKPKSGYQGIKHVFKNLRIIQYDPLNPCGRNPDLALQSRVDNYHPQDYYQWLYENRQGIECYDKVLCIIPIKDYPYTAHNRQYVVDHPEVKKYLKDNHKDLKDLLILIEKNGPISSGNIDSKGRKAGKNWYGYGQTWGKFALETLWKTGQIVIAKRINGKKYYHLPHKIYNKKHFKDNKHIESEHILRRISSVGLIKSQGMSDAWRGIGPTQQKNQIVNNLILNGKLIEVEIKDVKTKYVILAQDKHIFTQPISLFSQIRFIAPLDTLIWDRNMIEELFDFRYRWEVYTPVKKRQFGYYVLPILYKDRFIGRIEPVMQGNTLIIRNLWKEKNVTWTKEMNYKLKESIDKFRKYLNANNLIINKSATLFAI